MGRKRSNHLIVDYEIKNLPHDWREQVRDVIKHVAAEHRLYATTIDVGQFGQPPKVLIGMRREGAEEAWTETVQELLRGHVVRTLDRAKNEEVQRVVKKMGLEGARTAVAGGLVAIRDGSALSASERLTLHTQRADVALKVATALKDAVLGDAVADFVETALSRMKHPELFPVWAGLLLKLVEVDVALSPGLKRSVKKLL